MTANQSPLFSVSGFDAPSDHVGSNEAAMTALSADLEAAGMLEGKYKVMMTTLQQTARAVDRELSRGKVSVAVSNLTRMLLDGLDALPEPVMNTGDEYDALSDIIQTMTSGAMTGTDG